MNSVQLADSARSSQQPESVGESNNNTLRKTYVNGRNSAEGKQSVDRGNPVRDQTTGYGSTSQLATDRGSVNDVSGYGSTRHLTTLGSRNQVSKHSNMQQNAPCCSVNKISGPVSGRRRDASGAEPAHDDAAAAATDTYRNTKHPGSCEDQLTSSDPQLKGRGVKPTRPVTLIEGQSTMFLKWRSPDESRAGTLPNTSSRAISSDIVNNYSATAAESDGGIEMMSYEEFMNKMVAAGRWQLPSGSVHRDRRYPPPVYSYRYHPRQPSSTSHGRRHGYDSDTGYRSNIGNHSHRGGYNSDAGCRGDVGYRSDSECFRGNRFSSTNSASRRPPHPTSAFSESTSTQERSVLSGSRDGRIKVPLERSAGPHETIREEGETVVGNDAWISYVAQRTPDGRLQVWSFVFLATWKQVYFIMRTCYSLVLASRFAHPTVITMLWGGT